MMACIRQTTIYIPVRVACFSLWSLPQILQYHTPHVTDLEYENDIGTQNKNKHY